MRRLRLLLRPLAATTAALGFVITAAAPAGAAAHQGVYRSKGAAAMSTPVPVSPSGCYQRVDNPHRSLHKGWIAGELTTQCRNPVPEINQTAQLWEQRWWGWDRVGSKGAKHAFWKRYLKSWAKVTCRNSHLKTTGTGYVVDLDGSHYYASTYGAVVSNPCGL